MEADYRSRHRLLAACAFFMMFTPWVEQAQLTAPDELLDA